MCYLLLMDAIALPTVTMPRAAYAARFTLRVLRLLMSGPAPIRLLGQPARTRAAWNKFSPADVVRLAVMRRLTRHGFSTEAAGGILDLGVDQHLTGLILCGVDLPASFLLQRLDGVELTVCRSGAEVVVNPTHPHDTTLTLDIGAIARNAVARLADAHASTAAEPHGRFTGGRAGAAAGAPTNLSAGTPATESK